MLWWSYVSHNCALFLHSNKVIYVTAWLKFLNFSYIINGTLIEHIEEFQRFFDVRFLDITENMIFWNIKKSDVKKLLKIRNQLQFDMNNILAKNEKNRPRECGDISIWRTNFWNSRTKIKFYKIATCACSKTSARG